MSNHKNKIELLDAAVKKAEFNEHYLGWDDDYYMGHSSLYDDYDDFRWYYECDDYGYSSETKVGRMVDLNSISKERMRNSKIEKILGEETGSTTIRDLCPNFK